jgi:DNA-binding transcriptional LysR family regulator
VQVEYLHPDRVYEKVLEGTADFGLVSFPRKGRELVVLPWRDEEMVLACDPRHPLARCKSVKPLQLAGEKFVGFDKDLVIRRQVDRYLREHNVAVEVAMEFDNIENIKKAVEIRAGVAILPEPTLRREVADGSLVAVPLAGGRLTRPLGIIYRRQHKLHFATVKFMELLRQEARTNGVHHAHGPLSVGSSNGVQHRPRRRASTRTE